MTGMNINTKKRLYRSRADRRFAGVCGGIADYLAVDPTIVRIIWVLFAIAGGPGVVLYIILAAIIPEESEYVQTSAQKIKNDESG
ncbi:MAG: PspC domain-containing protein [Chloroflexi bacterium]|nr:PspC domain-containing protein [Chloroflexota bacterium]